MQEKIKSETVLTVFMLVKTTRAWLGKSIDERFAWGDAVLEPILKKHADNVSLRFYDVEFYNARVTDIFVWDVKNHKAYQVMVDELRAIEMWDHYFEIVEILAGVENAYAENHNRKTLSTA